MSPQNVQIVCRLLKSDQFCRCLATSTWSFPQRALGWPRILGAVLSAGNRALATQASETKLRSCVTSNLSQKKWVALSCCCCKPIFTLLLLVLKHFDLSLDLKSRLFFFLFAPAAAFPAAAQNGIFRTFFKRHLANYPFAQRRFRSCLFDHFFSFSVLVFYWEVFVG